MELKEANEVMGKFNIAFTNIKNKKDEFDTKRMHDKEAHGIYAGLRYAYIQMCELHEDLEKVLLK